MMIEDDLCLSDILGLSKRLFLEAGLKVDSKLVSDSEADDAVEEALDNGGDS